MKKRALLLASAFCAFIIAAPASASDRGPFAETPDLREQMRDSAFLARDLNEDLKIDKMEARKAINTTFKLMDRNGDNNMQIANNFFVKSIMHIRSVDRDGGDFIFDFQCYDVRGHENFLCRVLFLRVLGRCINFVG